jgi:hypothetical protein
MFEKAIEREPNNRQALYNPGRMEYAIETSSHERNHARALDLIREAEAEAERDGSHLRERTWYLAILHLASIYVEKKNASQNDLLKAKETASEGLRTADEVAVQLKGQSLFDRLFRRMGWTRDKPEIEQLRRFLEHRFRLNMLTVYGGILIKLIKALKGQDLSDVERSKKRKELEDEKNQTVMEIEGFAQRRDLNPSTYYNLACFYSIAGENETERRK